MHCAPEQRNIRNSILLATTYKYYLELPVSVAFALYMKVPLASSQYIYTLPSRIQKVHIFYRVKCPEYRQSRTSANAKLPNTIMFAIAFYSLPSTVGALYICCTFTVHEGPARPLSIHIYIA